MREHDRLRGDRLHKFFQCTWYRQAKIFLHTRLGFLLFTNPCERYKIEVSAVFTHMREFYLTYPVKV